MFRQAWVVLGKALRHALRRALAWKWRSERETRSGRSEPRAFLRLIASPTPPCVAIYEPAIASPIRDPSVFRSHASLRAICRAFSSKISKVLRHRFATVRFASHFSAREFVLLPDSACCATSRALSKYPRIRKRVERSRGDY